MQVRGAALELTVVCFKQVSLESYSYFLAALFAMTSSPLPGSSILSYCSGQHSRPLPKQLFAIRCHYSQVRSSERDVR